ncbi:MAG: hypothetical protein IPH13_20875 [Planctomycetes bacterium]|nr:hypothetical protein [Planctomycetota bacterium]
MSVLDHGFEYEERLQDGRYRCSCRCEYEANEWRATFNEAVADYRAHIESEGLRLFGTPEAKRRLNQLPSCIHGNKGDLIVYRDDEGRIKHFGIWTLCQCPCSVNAETEHDARSAWFALIGADDSMEYSVPAHEVINEARQALSELCHGATFRMSIPVNEELDHDRRIGRALDHADSFVRISDAHENDYQKIIAAVLKCDPVPASRRADDQLEPPWEVILRVLAERDKFEAELCDALKRLDACRATLSYVRALAVDIKDHGFVVGGTLGNLFSIIDAIDQREASNALMQ